MEEKHDFELSANELEFLQCLAADDNMLSSLLRLQGHAQRLPVVISLSRAEAEVFRDRLTYYLASVGFDEDYALNEQGQLLEALIDQFYIDQ
jgi:hypothetical protein